MGPISHEFLARFSRAILPGDIRPYISIRVRNYCSNWTLLWDLEVQEKVLKIQTPNVSVWVKYEVVVVNHSSGSVGGIDGLNRLIKQNSQPFGQLRLRPEAQPTLRVPRGLGFAKSMTKLMTSQYGAKFKRLSLDSRQEWPWRPRRRCQRGQRRTAPARWWS